MSVIIKGMEMPIGCFSCPLVSGYMIFQSKDDEQPTINSSLCRVSRKVVTRIEGRPFGCPLEEYKE